jgi:hypothetical protein
MVLKLSDSHWVQVCNHLSSVRINCTQISVWIFVIRTDLVLYKSYRNDQQDATV